MNVRDSDFDRLLAEWLEDEQFVAPAAPVEAAVDFASTHPRRRAWLAFARRDAMTTRRTTGLRPVAILVAIVAVLVLAVGGAVLIGSRPHATPTPIASPTVDAAHLPPPVPDYVMAAPGRYTMRGPSSGVATAGWPSVVTATLPAGWSQLGAAFGSGLQKPSADKSQAELSMWSVGNVVVDGCRESREGQVPREVVLMDPPVGPSVGELAAALRVIPDVRATAPVAAAVDGFGGVRLNLTVPGQLGCELWRSPQDSRDETWGYYSRAGWLHQVWVVDVDGLRFLVVAATAPDAPAELLRELDQMVASIDIVP